MSRTVKSNPDRVCPIGRRRCNYCQGQLQPWKRIKLKDRRRGGDRLELYLRDATRTDALEVDGDCDARLPSLNRGHDGEQQHDSCVLR